MTRPSVYGLLLRRQSSAVRLKGSPKTLTAALFFVNNYLSPLSAQGGQGKIRLLLLMAGSASERLQSVRTAPRVHPMSSDQEQPTSILIVDDNHDAADQTCYILSHLGYPAQLAYYAGT